MRSGLGLHAVHEFTCSIGHLVASGNNAVGKHGVAPPVALRVLCAASRTNGTRNVSRGREVVMTWLTALGAASLVAYAVIVAMTAQAGATSRPRIAECAQAPLILQPHFRPAAAVTMAVMVIITDTVISKKVLES